MTDLRPDAAGLNPMNPSSRFPLRSGIVLTFLASLFAAAAPLAAAEKTAPAYATIDEAIARGDVADVKRHLERDPALAKGQAGAKLLPLHQAILRRQLKIVPVLLEAGADVQTPDTAGRTPLHLAVERGDAGIVAELLRRKADPTKRDRIGWTPLHHAAAKNRLEIATLLLDSGMNPNLLSELGGTPLHEGAAAGSVEMVKLLLARGVDPTVRSKPGVTALDLAREYKHPEVVTLLEGAKPKS
jgi:ankyrin repeat protein